MDDLQNTTPNPHGDNNKMKCPRCGKRFDTKTRYNPTTKQNDLPYTTYSHSFYLSELIKNPNTICKHTERVNNP